MSPDQLLTALNREVIKKEPQQFKIPCLQEVQKLFPQPAFFAGFGNRETDLISYDAVGISKQLVFIVDDKGFLQCKVGAASYQQLASIVDSVFPS